MGWNEYIAQGIYYYYIFSPLFVERKLSFVCSKALRNDKYKRWNEILTKKCSYKTSFLPEETLNWVSLFILVSRVQIWLIKLHFHNLLNLVNQNRGSIIFYNMFFFGLRFSYDNIYICECYGICSPILIFTWFEW